jgi:hypothetical protein
MLWIRLSYRLSDRLCFFAGDSSDLVQFSEKLKPPQQGDPFLLTEISQVLVVGHTRETVPFGRKQAQPILKRCRCGLADGGICVFDLGLDDSHPKFYKLVFTINIIDLVYDRAYHMKSSHMLNYELQKIPVRFDEIN